MLSRIAEAMYWMGRHIERADTTARIVDTYLHLLPSGTWKQENQIVRELVESMGLAEGTPDDPDLLIRALVFDGERASSVAGALIAARDNARGVRDVVPMEVWECLNVTWHGLRTRSTSAAGPHTFLRWVAERSAMANGLIDQMMSHDEGWHFLNVGRSLERADMTVRLLASATQGTGTPWRALVTATGGFEPFVRYHGENMGRRSALEFVLLDRRFPRSVFRAMNAAELSLAELEAAGANSYGDPRRDPSSARRLIGRVRTGLEYRSGPELEDELTTVLTTLQRAVENAHVAVTKSFFRQGDAVTWANQSTLGALA
ncbi:alpha-E domain-containing protein [Nakamurella deserti]|uniref:alpha-E domain-containing protein n=1 Tax=Nakamurella deserti TaxID=2164074 RepID=UPI000DBE298A|nr:alpha-E domain-containing protein [Nakamurella deserti]